MSALALDLHEPRGWVFIADSDAPAPRNEVHEGVFTDPWPEAWLRVGEIDSLEFDDDILRFDLLSFTSGMMIPTKDLLVWTSVGVESKDASFRLVARELSVGDPQPFKRYTRSAWPFSYRLRREDPRYEVWLAAPPVH